MTTRVLLVGGGHAHLHVVSQAEAFRSAGAELSLVDPDMLWYSGMATGMLGGMYSPEEDRVDLRALCERHGVTFHQTKADSLDRETRIVHTESGDAFPYDLLSLNVGSAVDMSKIADPGRTAWTVKPIPGLLDLQKALKVHVDAGRTCRVGVVGGGPTGSEIAANIEAFTRRAGGKASVTLLNGNARLLPGFPAEAADRLAGVFRKRGINVESETRVVELRRTDEGVVVTTAAGRELGFDEVVLASGLVPSPTIAALGLGDAGLQVTTRLASRYDETIFGAGDCITFEGRDLPKVGVFGVRQAPILSDNLLASVRGSELREYEPQKKFLIILNLGDGTGLAIRGNWHWYGRLALTVKNFIDTRFMKKYQR